MDGAITQEPLRRAVRRRRQARSAAECGVGAQRRGLDHARHSTMMKCVMGGPGPELTSGLNVRNDVRLKHGAREMIAIGRRIRDARSGRSDTHFPRRRFTALPDRRKRLDSSLGPQAYGRARARQHSARFARRWRGVDPPSARPTRLLSSDERTR